MNVSINQLENIITINLQSINTLKNDLEKKEYEKKDQLKKIAEEVIQIIDSFELIEENFIEKGMDKDEGVSKAMTRYKAIEKKLLILLQKYGITRIEFPENKLIVGWCEVVETEVDGNRRNDDIISIVRSGYIRGKELIRPAQLIVVKN